MKSHKDGEYRLKYIYPGGEVVDAGEYRGDEPWYAGWLDSMVNATEDAIFFIVRIEWATDLWPERTGLEIMESNIHKAIGIPTTIYNKIRIPKEDIS